MDQYYTYIHIEKKTRTSFYIGIGKNRRVFSKKRSEGGFIQLYPDDSELEQWLTEYGKNLFLKPKSSFNSDNLSIFLKEAINKKANDIKDNMNTVLIKKTKPRKRLVIPFCLTEPVSKSDNFTINISDLESMSKVINKPIVINDLPVGEYVDFYVHGL